MTTPNKRSRSPTFAYLSPDYLNFYKNIEKMRDRLPKISFIEKEVIHKPPIPLHKNFFVAKENKYFSKKIYNMRIKPMKPEINYFNIELGERLLEYKKREREIEKKIISEENKRYKEKVFNQRSLFCCEDYLGKNFQERHDKLIAQICPVKPSESLILPPINIRKNKKREKTKSTFAPENEKVENENDKIIEGKDLNQQTQGAKQKTIIEENNEIYRKNEESKEKKAL